MNVSVTANKVIDKAILLKEGGVIVIPCSSYEEMERLRIRLYKLRKQLRENYKEIALSLDICRKISGDNSRWTIYITKDTNLTGVLIIENGEARPFEDEDEDSYIQRDKDEDEHKEEKEEKEEEKEENFDDVAAEIERTQGLIEDDSLEPAQEKI